jgi:hypothetical protein
VTCFSIHIIYVRLSPSSNDICGSPRNTSLRRELSELRPRMPWGARNMPFVHVNTGDSSDQVSQFIDGYHSILPQILRARNNQTALACISR